MPVAKYIFSKSLMSLLFFLMFLLLFLLLLLLCLATECCHGKKEGCQQNQAKPSLEVLHWLVALCNLVKLSFWWLSSRKMVKRCKDDSI